MIQLPWAVNITIYGNIDILPIPTPHQAFHIASNKSKVGPCDMTLWRWRS